MTARQLILARFHDYNAAQRAAHALIVSGVPAGDICIALAEQTADRDPDRLPEGRALLTVRAVEAGPIREVIERYGPVRVETRSDAEPVTMSGAPADQPASPGGVPHAGPDEWLIRKEGDLVTEIDPEQGPKRED